MYFQPFNLPTTERNRHQRTSQAILVPANVSRAYNRCSTKSRIQHSNSSVKIAMLLYDSVPCRGIPVSTFIRFVKCVHTETELSHLPAAFPHKVELHLEPDRGILIDLKV